MGPHDISPNSPATSCEVAVCIPVEEGDERFVPSLLAELARPSSVALDLVLCDLTLDGELAARVDLPPNACVVRGVPGSRGGAYRAALEATEAPFVAWQLARASAPAGRLALQAAALRANPDAELATCDLLVRGETGEARHTAASGEGWIGSLGEAAAPATTRHVPFGSDGTPPACWETAVMARREALAGIETACFAPVELAFLLERRAAGATVHVPEPLACVDAGLFEARAARTADDAVLVDLARTPHEGPPEVTVLLATHNRRDVFLECLSGFCRQHLPPGALEIVAIDDGSLDGTGELGPRLDLPVRFVYLRQDPADGASRARILGMPHAKGRLILFVNDDTIPFADTVQHHLDAHAELGERKATVLGTFEQKPAHLTNAFMEMLEGSNHVFGYIGLKPGQTLPPAYFYTCHVSVDLALVREVGGFDPEFSHYGCEDTDLGVRLEAAGVPIVYRPECRAIHDHFLPFDNIRRRQRVVAKAHVRLFEKYPEMLAEHPWWRDLTKAEIVRRNAGVMPALERIEDACRTLADVDLAQLARGGKACRDTVLKVQEQLRELFPKLNGVWWDQGFLEGFEVHGLEGFPELLARAEPAVKEALHA